jgi:hypothetical protein
MIQLRSYQREAVYNLHIGSILCGGVGSGKSRTALAYYYFQEGGDLGSSNYARMDHPRDLYIITTARKRDTHEWESEMIPFYISTKPENDLYSDEGHKVVVDSWNNISKYVGVEGAFFIFDEQRVVGKGAWVKAFLKITQVNDWILLSATPGDKWEDYIPVFIANGFYRNRTEFSREHLIYGAFRGFQTVTGYMNTRRLVRLRDKILVNMDFMRPTVAHHEDIWCEYSREEYKKVVKERWNYVKDQPIENASEFCYILRKLVNLDESRQVKLLELIEKHPKCIIFYNFDDELELLKTILGACKGFEVAEWNGHKHQAVPDGEKWAYLVQYNAGSEGWNCIKTDTIIFYSQNYSYKTLIQAAGRIDRMNTPFKDLYFYHFKSHSPIDLAISKALKEKKKFNETKFSPDFGERR